MSKGILFEKKILPGYYKNTYFSSVKDIQKYTGASLSTISAYGKESATLADLMERLELRNVRKTNKPLLPDWYNNQYFETYAQVAQYLGKEVSAVRKHAEKSNVTCLEDLISEVRNVKEPAIKRKKIIPDWYEGKYFTSQNQIAEYVGTTKTTVREYAEKEEITNITELIENLRGVIRDNRSFSKDNENLASNVYPIVVNGKYYYSDNDIAEELNISSRTVRRKRLAGDSLKQLILGKVSIRRIRGVFKNEFPLSVKSKHFRNIEEFIQNLKSNGIIMNTEQLQDKYYYYVLERGYTLEEFYDSLFGNSIEGKTKVIINKTPNSASNFSSRSIWVLDIVLMGSMKKLSEKLGIPYFRLKSKSDQDIIDAYITTRLKDYSGYITPNLVIEEFCWKDGSTQYFRCSYNNEIVYLSDKEILTIRLETIIINKRKPEELYDGVYDVFLRNTSEKFKNWEERVGKA